MKRERAHMHIAPPLWTHRRSFYFTKLLFGGSGQKNQMSQDGQTKALTIIIIIIFKRRKSKTETKPQVEANIHNSKKVRNQAPRLAVKWNVVETNVKKGASFLSKTLCSNGALQIPTEIGNGESPQALLQDSF